MSAGKNIWILTKQSQALYRGILGPKFGLNFIENLENLETNIKRTKFFSHAIIVDASNVGLPDSVLYRLPIRTPVLLVLPSHENLNLGRTRSYLFQQNFDFIQNPIRKFELLTRLEILFSRSLPTSVELTNREAQIFSVFQRSGGSPIQRRAIVKEVWGDVIVGAKTLDVHLFHLRKKIFNAGFKIHFSPPDTFTLTTDPS